MSMRSNQSLVGGEGYIVLNSQSRINRTTTNPEDARYNLKYVNIDPSFNYKISVESFYCIVNASTTQIAEDYTNQLYIIESNIVKNNDYTSLSDVDSENYSTRGILSVIDPSTPNLSTTAGEAIKSFTVDYAGKQEMSLNNFSDIFIKIRDTDGDILNRVDATLDEYTIVMKYERQPK